MEEDVEAVAAIVIAARATDVQTVQGLLYLGMVLFHDGEAP